MSGRMDPKSEAASLTSSTSKMMRSSALVQSMRMSMSSGAHVRTKRTDTVVSALLMKSAALMQSMGARNPTPLQRSKVIKF